MYGLAFYILAQFYPPNKSIIYFKFFLRFLSVISLELDEVVLELLDALLLVSTVLLSFRSRLTARLTRLLMPASVLLNLGRTLIYESNDC